MQMLFDEKKDTRLSTSKGNNSVSFKVYNALYQKQALDDEGEGQPEAQLSLVA